MHPRDEVTRESEPDREGIAKQIKKLGDQDVLLTDTVQRGLTLRLRPSGTHAYRVQLGRGRFLTLGEAANLTPTEARSMASAKRGEQDKFKTGMGPDPMLEARRKKAGTLADFLDQHFEPWAQGNLKTGSVTSTRVKAIFPNLLDRRLDEITAFQVEAWRTKRHRAGVKPSTTNRDIDDLRSVLSKAIEWKLLLTAHPLKSVKRAETDSTGRLRYLDADEETRLRAALTAREARVRAERESYNKWCAKRGYRTLPRFPDGVYVDHLQPIVLTALLTGARRGELFDLVWGKVDLVRNVIEIAGTTTKTGKTRRVPLCDEARAVLKTWRDQHDETEPDMLVFPSPQTDKRLDNITSSWGALVKAAKLQDFTYHDLRHSFASRLVQAGVDLYVVQKLLGHSSSLMTERYAHLNDEIKVQAVATFNRR